MKLSASTPAIAFANGTDCIASGDLLPVALKVKAALDARPDLQILVLNRDTSEQLDLDLRGNAQAITRWLQGETESAVSSAGEEALPPASRGRGRPRLGVVAREVTLLPRHWDWLNAQPGGASVALRKLVEEASRAGQDRDRLRQAQEAAYRFMSTLAGNRSNFEEAARALFAGKSEHFHQLVGEWPADVRAHLHRLAEPAFAPLEDHHPDQS